MIASPVKVQIRARYGTIKAFEKAKGLRPHAVRDHLRGCSVSAAERAIVAEFGPHDLERPRRKTRRAQADRCLDVDQIAARSIAELEAAIERARTAIADLQLARTTRS